MDTKALRQKILDLAIRGKLVPQDPNDEPASVLLERIREQKKQMVKDGKLKPKDIKKDTVIFKGDDNLHYEKFPDGTVKCIEDEIPFELPEGWAWCRVRNIAIVKGGKRLPKGASFSEKKTSHAYIRVTDMKNHSININDLRYISEDIFLTIKNYTIAKDDLYVTIAGTIGVVGEVPDLLDGMNITENAVKITNIAINKSFLCIVLQTELVQQQFKDKTHQVAMPKLALERILSTLIPICPSAQQTKIVDKIQICDKFLSTINVEQDELQKILALSKSKILDLAIHGKLVPQDPNDEPASMLLERIREEKEELIKQGKIKRNKKESVIFKGDDNSYYEKVDNEVRCIDTEIPYDLPDGWIWCRLGNIGEWQTGATPSRKKTEYYNGTMPWIKTGDLNNGYIKVVPESITELAITNTSVKIIPENTVIIAMYGATIGKVGITTSTATTNQACCACCNPKMVREKYLFYFLMSYKNAFVSIAEGGAQPNISKEKITATLIPFPSIAEQIRIYTAIDNAFSVLDYIEKLLN